MKFKTKLWVTFSFCPQFSTIHHQCYNLHMPSHSVSAIWVFFLFRPKIKFYLAQLKPWLRFLLTNLGVTTKQNFKHSSPNIHYQPDICTQLHKIVHCSLLSNFILYSCHKKTRSQSFFLFTIIIFKA